jgi:hypothetical protein
MCLALASPFDLRFPLVNATLLTPPPFHWTRLRLDCGLGWKEAIAMVAPLAIPLIARITDIETCLVGFLARLN